MKTSRRTFIRAGAMAVVAASVRPSSLFASSKAKGIIGLQLYSIREDMARDPLGSLTQVAKMGYEYVEHANYVNGKFYGYSPGEFRKVLDGLGLKMISGHTVMGKQHWDEARKDFSDSWKQTVNDAAVLGQEYVVSPSMDMTMRNNYDDFRKYMDVFNKCGDLCKRHGMKFGYHNHDFEFSEKLRGEKLFDIMMKSIDPDKVVIQLDIGNMYNGGAVALDVVKQYPGRFENLHVKDEILSSGGPEKYESTIIGKGIVNAREVVDLATRIGGTRVYIIEQESYQGMSPMDCVKEDLRIMKEWGY
ncbi:MAG TPA: sugar phosphate isomerase/epimerase family protein [Bacteroidales bacterium]|nr:TIM barrel protein [Bacteroidales bacterium]HNR40954.1 sugar phosphate isomerase/epimerase family protein [Bacteroidales bacterium]HPM17864.1 sugar phosphate isomerase/epimerase family protein [Bacteroidales bacterium]HQG76499.1 sugar phosphate isomerase/epimerase family protein [Bacteroidales bacterium]